MSEGKSRLQKKQEELESLELDNEILTLEERIQRRQRGEPASPPEPRSSLGDKLVEEVVIPIVKKNLEPEKSSSVTQDALRVANKALDKAGRQAPPPAGNSISDIVSALAQFKTLLGDDSQKQKIDDLSQQLKALAESPPQEGELEMIEKVLGIVDKIQERVQPSGGSSDKYYDFEKWRTEQERKNLMQDRAFNLRIRQQDKDHDLKLAELGIEKERNDLLKDGLKRIGAAIGEVLDEEDDFIEEQPPAEGRGQLIKESCSECGAQILIPPEAQVKGKEIKCSKCNAVFVWE